MQASCLSTRHPTRPSAASRLKRAALSCVHWMSARVETWQHARHAAAKRRVLRSLSNETLKDMGLDRSDIESWIACGDTDRRARG
jgi:uncharacterized protein YjiS (DUF1127 family)